MQKIMLLSVFFALLLSGCQTALSFPAAAEDKRATYTIDAQGEKAQLFEKTNLWAVKTFKSADTVIQYSDKEAGLISGRYLANGKITFSTYGSYDSRQYCSFTITVKDNNIQLDFEAEGFVAADDIEEMYIKSYDGSGEPAYLRAKDYKERWKGLVDRLKATL